MQPEWILISTVVVELMLDVDRLNFAMWHDIFSILDELIKKQGFGIAGKTALSHCLFPHT